jgi:TetR/AcrR family tetracycline transcriptional repressor
MVAALALADAEGVDKLTMRRLANTLGVTPMALYWHYPSKDELLDAMAASVFERIDRSLDPTTTWQEQLRELLGSVLDALRAHPPVARLVSTRTVSTAEALDTTEVLLDIMRRAGFSPTQATQIARHALSTVANLVGAPPGVVVGEGANDRNTRRRARDLLTSLPPERYPRLREAAAPISEGVRPDAYTTFGLDLLLAGIEALAPQYDDHRGTAQSSPRRSGRRD